jgi:hypothetical protein
MSMPCVDARRSSAMRSQPRMWAMDILLVLMLIAVLGLFSQAVGADSRGSGGRAG